MLPIFPAWRRHLWPLLGKQPAAHYNGPMKLSLAALAILLAACATQPQRPVREGPTYGGQRDLDALVSFFTGNWDPKPGEPPMRLRVVEFWKGSPVRWLYLEWVQIGAAATPTRQLVLRVAEDGDEGIMTSTVYRLPGDAARHAGEWRKPAPFSGMRPEELREIPDCRLNAARVMTAHFTLVTAGNRCPGDLPGSPFMRFEFSLSSSELALLEQPRDAAGNVPPSRVDPFQFGRMSREPK
jgi:hypothetical protein